MVARSLFITHNTDSPAKQKLLPSDPFCRQGIRPLKESNDSVKATQLPCVSIRIGTQVGVKGPAFTAFDVKGDRADLLCCSRLPLSYMKVES